MSFKLIKRQWTIWTKWNLRKSGKISAIEHKIISINRTISICSICKDLSHKTKNRESETKIPTKKYLSLAHLNGPRFLKIITHNLKEAWQLLELTGTKDKNPIKKWLILDCPMILITLEMLLCLLMLNNLIMAKTQALLINKTRVFHTIWRILLLSLHSRERGPRLEMDPPSQIKSPLCALKKED
jgi:hypothetical protein